MITIIIIIIIIVVIIIVVVVDERAVTVQECDFATANASRKPCLRLAAT